MFNIPQTYEDYLSLSAEDRDRLQMYTLMENVAQINEKVEKVYYVTDIRDSVALFEGSIEDCKEFQEQSGGGTKVVDSLSPEMMTAWIRHYGGIPYGWTDISIEKDVE